jgi:hypothetical protein
MATRSVAMLAAKVQVAQQRDGAQVSAIATVSTIPT